MSVKRETFTVTRPCPALDSAMFETMVHFRRHPFRAGNIKFDLQDATAKFDEVLQREEYIYVFNVEWEDPYK